ncbi:MAG: sugar transferase [Gammaproteobacteria bacterium]|nr:sugar transferase [Gammaproteobacteria bacterium]MCP5136674.1 sugar transferase [Gammaproteobacteria bacterium]
MEQPLKHEPYDAWSDSELLDEVLDKYSGHGRGPNPKTARARITVKRLAFKAVVYSTYALKRVFDVVASLIAILLLSPVFLLTWAAIKIEDPGPAIFTQIRVGKWGKPFTMYKFRSMVMNAEELKKKLMAQNESSAGVIFKMKEDPRITKVGKIIRKLSIDELPQLFNVLFGHMSLVGPRPALPIEVAEYSMEHRRRLDALPGITCLWQIGGRSDIDFEGQVRLDVQYIRSQGFWADFVILLKTVPAVLLGKGAY